MKFVFPNEPEVRPYIFQKFRSAAIEDLIKFLKLRADELSDNGEGIFLMAGGGSNGNDELDSTNQYGGQKIGFIHRKEGSILREAYENAAKDFANEHIEKDIKRAHRASFVNAFLRCESDVLESFEHVKDVLELKELKWENCPVTCGSPEKLGDFIWSIFENSLTECTKTMIGKKDSIGIKEKDDLTKEIMNAVKHHLYIITKRDFPDGKLDHTYMYMVIKRKPRC